jgi:hypothetical protein
MNGESRASAPPLRDPVLALLFAAGLMLGACADLNSLGGSCVDADDCDDGQICAADKTCQVAMGSESGPDPSDGGCHEGHENCACAGEGICLGGLACVDGTCIPAEDPGTGDAGDSSGKLGEDSGGDESGVSPCVDSSECASTEVCSYGYCGDTDFFYFDVFVLRFEPMSCLDGWGGSEMYFEYFEGGEFRSQSPWSECPSAWPDNPVPYDSVRTFQLNFWEADAFVDDLITGFCVEGELATGCAPIPKQALHDGAWVGTTPDGGFEVELWILLAE